MDEPSATSTTNMQPENQVPEPTPPTSPTAPESPSDDPPPHRSHSPTTNQKRSSPFQFGSRFLLPDDDPYEFNAWDHVEPASDDLEKIEAKIMAQKSSPVSPFDAHRFNTTPAKWWNRFYAHNTSNFFKDRKWLFQEFPVLTSVTRAGAGPKCVLEVGAGAGNTCFPVLRSNRNRELRVWACDFSSKAIDVIRTSEAYEEHREHLRAEVWDLASPPPNNLPAGLEEGAVDVILMIFVFSALHPSQWEQA
ncbi:MAG: hypothetical protein Q9222_003839, partial [Ikaeria aurantiellina]